MPAGRPSKLTPELTSRLFKAIEAGHSLRAACSTAGLDYSTVKKWATKGEAQKQGEYFTFFTQYQAAKGNALSLHEEWVLKPENAKWILERRAPEEWGKKESVEVDHSGTISFEWVDE